MFNKVLQDDEREGQLDLNTLLNHFDEFEDGYWPKKKCLCFANHFDAYTVYWAAIDQVDVLSSWEG